VISGLQAILVRNRPAGRQAERGGPACPPATVAPGALLTESLDCGGLARIALVPVAGLFILFTAALCPIMGVLGGLVGAIAMVVKHTLAAIFRPIRRCGVIIPHILNAIGWVSMVAPRTAAARPVHQLANSSVSHGAAYQPVRDAVAEETVEDLVAAVLADLPAETGDSRLPPDTGAVAYLLGSPPPTSDAEACRALRAAFPGKDMGQNNSRVLLAIAITLTSRIAGPGRLPQAATQAWRMLDAVVFEREFASQLHHITATIATRQADRAAIITLEQYETDLIEFLFETLSPERNAPLLSEVLDMRVLSNRRVGLLRRIPYRVKRFIETHPQGALIRAVAVEDFLDGICHHHPYPPIAEAATEAMEQVKKMVDALTTAPAAPPTPPPAKGAALGNIFDGIHRPAAAPARPAALTVVRQAPMIAAAVRPMGSPMVSISAHPLPPTVHSPDDRRKAVLQVLGGAEKASVAQAFHVDPNELDHWKEAFLNAGNAALTAGDGLSAAQLKAKLAEVLETAQVLEKALEATLRAP
jgi:hypothetical protein